MCKCRWILMIALTAALAGATATGAEVTGEAFEGRLEIIRADNFVTGMSTITYSLRMVSADDSQTVLQLTFPDGAPDNHWRSGDAVIVHGTRIGAAIQVTSLQPPPSRSANAAVGSAPDLPQAAAAIEDRRAVVIIVDMLDADNELSVSDVAGFMYNDDKNVDGLYKASSFQQLGFNPDTDGDGDPDIFGPFTINYNASGGCDYAAWATAADAAARAAGIDLDIYQHKVYALPGAASCGWAGLGTVGCDYYCAVWIRDGGGPVFAHELGHNLNWHHSATDPDNDGNLDSEYGDQSGIMGWPRWSQANAPHRDQKQWFDAFPGTQQQVQTSGVFELDALELDPGVDTVATQVIKIPKNDTNEYYYLSYRRQVGDYPVYSPYADKIHIHYNDGIAGRSALVDTLAQGEAFTDSINEITVTATAAGTARATVTVSVSGSPANIQPTAGFSTGIDNLSVQFSDSSSDSDGTITGWSWDFGDGNTSSLTSPNHTYAVSGTYLVRLAVTDNAGGMGVATRSVTTNQPPTAQIAITINDLEVGFDSTCADSDGTIQSYTWDFGDGNGSAASDPVHTYASRRDYTATLVVRDNDGATTTVSRVVQLAPSVAASTGSGTGGGGSSSGGCFIHALGE